MIENGYDPEPDLTVRSTWWEFIKSHWNVLTACDFFTIELMVGRKLSRCTVFFVIELPTRKVFFAPAKPQPDGSYYHNKRIHQGVGRIIEPKHVIDDTAEIVCIERLGGLLKSYHRLAA